MASSGSIFSRRMPGSPWMPTPISISSSARVKPGLPAAGTVQGAMATPMVRTLSMTFSATRLTSARGLPASAAAPAHLCTKTVPATPRRCSRWVGVPTATSSFTTTWSQATPSSRAASSASLKLMTSPV